MLRDSKTDKSFYQPKWLILLLAEMMMNNNIAKFTSPPKNNAERRKGEWLIKYIKDLPVTSKP